MARRQIEEINAGSMADIAFLLLIFFLVTTTMEVDAGISRILPLKRDIPENIPLPEVHDRDILVIMANSQDQLLVEGEFMEIEDLEDKVRDFYMANINSETDSKMPPYQTITGELINQKLATFKDAVENGPKSAKEYNQGEYDKWEKKRRTFNAIGAYREISNSALIQLKNQSNTSYGLYIQIQDILKKVVTDLKAEKCAELGWGEFKNLDKNNPDDQEKLEILQVLVPERIIEAKIER